MALDPLIINRDEAVQRSQCIFAHDGFVSAGLVAFSRLQFSQIRDPELKR